MLECTKMQLKMPINVEDSSADSAIVLDVTTKYGQKSNQLSSKATNTKQSARKKWHQKLFKVDVIVVTITIAIVIGLFQLPIIYFYIPVNDDLEQMPPTDTVLLNSSCIPYTGEFCREELLSQREDCLLEPRTSDLLILNNPNQLFISQIGSLSPGCRATGVSFLCLLTLGVCDNNGAQVLPSKETCIEISNGACHVEFEQAGTLGFSIPDCSILPEEEFLICLSRNRSGVLPPTPSSSKCNITCRENFYCDDFNNQCTPICPDWEIYGPAAATVFITCVWICNIIGALGGIGVLIMYGLRFKQFGFPSILVIYQTIALLIFEFVLLIGSLDRSGLYCNSKNYLDSIFNATPYCIISGALLIYCTLQINILWVLHALFLFASVAFPFQYRTLKNSSKMKYIHIGSVVFSLLFPLISVITPMINDAIKRNRASDGEVFAGTLGFMIANSPPVFCNEIDRNAMFYFSTLPNIIIAEIGVVVLILSVWLINKHHKAKESRNPFSFGTPEKKLLIVSFYYVALEVLGFLSFSLPQRNRDRLQEELQIYFMCESQGHNPDNPCDRSRFVQLNYPIISILSISIILLTPVVNFVFIVNVKLLKEKLTAFRSIVQAQFTNFFSKNSIS